MEALISERGREILRNRAALAEIARAILMKPTQVASKQGVTVVVDDGSGSSKTYQIRSVAAFAHASE